MATKFILTSIVILALLGMACRVSIDLPIDRMVTGPTRTETILIPAPDAAIVNLQIDFDAGSLEIAPGAATALVEGTATYNISDLKPEVDVQGDTVRLSTGEFSIEGIPSINYDNLENTWDLKLGSQALVLTLNGGAMEGKVELGGLALHSLFASSGAAKYSINFSQPNKAEMKIFQYETGASDSNLVGLGNANFTTMVFRGGAGDYTLDFSGDLQKDASVVVDAGLGRVTVIVPEGVPAEVNFKGGLSNVDARGAWQKSGNVYSQSGSGPALTITVTMGAGNLTLRNVP